MIALLSLLPVQVVLGGTVLLLSAIVLGVTYILLPIHPLLFGEPAEAEGSDPDGLDTTTVSVDVADGGTGRAVTQYPHADTVIGHLVSFEATEAAGLDDIEATEVEATEEINLTDAEGGAELICGTWVFEVEENGQVIGRQRHDIEYGVEDNHVGLYVDLHILETRVTAGPGQEPLEGATVEARGDAGGWSLRKPTDWEGWVQFEVPQSASPVSFTATYENLPPAESQVQLKRVGCEGVNLRIADGTGAMTVETMIGDQIWPKVDVRITPVSAGAKAYTDEGTITTKSGGRQTVDGLPVGEYEVYAHPQADSVDTTAAVESLPVESVDTTAAVERITIEGGETVEVNLSARFSYTMSAAKRKRITELESRIEGLATDPDYDVIIPRYYGTVLASVLELTEAIESTPERTIGAAISPDAAVESLLDAIDGGLDVIFSAMSERLVADLLEACVSMPTARVKWDGDVTLDAFLDRVTGSQDEVLEGFYDQVAETGEFLDQQWGNVHETAPVRKLHNRLKELAAELGDTDDQLVIGAQVYVGFCLLEAIEELFEHDALVKRLNGRVL